MSPVSMSCVLLADRHHRFIEGVRDMLDTEFETLFIVSTEASLLEGAARLQPAVVIVDLSLLPGRMPEVLQRLRTCSPHTKMLLLTAHDQASVARFALEAKVDGVVLKRSIATDLHAAVDAALANRQFVSPGIAQATQDDRTSRD